MSDQRSSLRAVLDGDYNIPTVALQYARTEITNIHSKLPNEPEFVAMRLYLASKITELDTIISAREMLDE